MVVLSVSLLSLIFSAGASAKVAGVDGKTHRPFAEAAGKPLAVIFISHNCPVCNTYAPEIGRIESAYGSRVRFDIVYSEPSLSKTQARQHAREYAIDHATLLLDPSCEFAAYCAATVTPQAVVYDANGRRVYSGRIDDRYYALGQQRPAPTTHDLAKALDSVLAHKPPKPASAAPVGCFILKPHST